MIQRARELRQRTVQDSTLFSYSSEARGYIYFYLDREDTGERILVKTDQIALQVFWQAPDRIKQRIVGLRDEKSLPTNIHYHLDHLVVVQDEFGDRIRIGDGDEVAAVVHPAAPGAESVYDFLLADSVTLSLPASLDTVRVYEIQVKPKDFEVPGFIGSVYLDRDTQAIVRMSFTFTPASYVDPYLHHISISLENGLWEGRHWLPYRQQLEIRREVPFLDIPAGSVIRGSFEVRNYEINPSLPAGLFLGRPITALPEAQRRAFSFEDSLHAQLEEEGLLGFRPPPEMDEIRAQALAIARDQYLSGLGPSRLYLPSPTASSALRYNRAEGLFLGAGFSHRLRPRMGLALYGGFSFGRERPTVEGKISGGEHRPLTNLTGFLNRSLDLGPVPAISGTLNTLSSLTLAKDFTDLYFASGVAATHTVTAGSDSPWTFTARREEHHSARDVVSSDLDDTDFRPVQAVDEGTWTSLEAAGALPLPRPDLRLTVHGLFGRFDVLSQEEGARGDPIQGRDGTFGSLSGTLTYLRRWLTRGATLEADVRGGTLFGTPPLQAHFFLGGRGSLPGYDFRSQAGEKYWLARAEASMDLLPPLLRLRVFGAAGRAWGGDPLFDTLGGQPNDPPTLFSTGLGLGFGWDILRLDLARGLRTGGDWGVILSVRHDFWPWL
jgi:hypothetical protein